MSDEKDPKRVRIDPKVKPTARPTLPGKRPLPGRDIAERPHPDLVDNTMIPASVWPVVREIQEHDKIRRDIKIDGPTKPGGG